MILRQYLHPERYLEAAAAADHLSDRLHALSDCLEVLPGANAPPVES